MDLLLRLRQSTSLQIHDPDVELDVGNTAVCCLRLVWISVLHTKLQLALKTYSHCSEQVAPEGILGGNDCQRP